MELTPCDLKNGDGIRVTLWVVGCGHHCPGCQNPETWDEKVWDPGSWKEVDEEFYRELDRLLEDPDIQGLTISGGDPLYPSNREGVLEVCRHVRWNHPMKDIWLWTGYVYEDIREKCADILALVDVLVDGPYLEKVRQADIAAGQDPKWRGSSNQRVLDLRNMRRERH